MIIFECTSQNKNLNFSNARSNYSCNLNNLLSISILREHKQFQQLKRFILGFISFSLLFGLLLVSLALWARTVLSFSLSTGDHRYSLLVVKHLHSSHESTDADAIVTRIADFLGLVVHSIEFSDFVTVADGFEQVLDGGPVPWHLEVRLLNADLCEG